MKKANHLILGTVQLGLPYGIANIHGKPDDDVAFNIIRTAVNEDIIEFDTAQEYGDSEKILGNIFNKLGCQKKVSVISKLSPKVDHFSIKETEKAVKNSLERLQINTLEGLLLHQEDMLDQWENGIRETMLNLCHKGFVKRIGISLYTPERSIQALKADGLDIIQIPTNILDQRFENIGLFDKADKFGKEIHTRSIFLQGLFFLTPETLPEKMGFALKVLNELKSLMEYWQLTIQELTFGYLQKKYPQAKILFGVEICDQISENIEACHTELSKECMEDIKKAFSNVDKKILNPVFWS